MPILVHFKAKNNDNFYFYKNSGLSFPRVPYYVKDKLIDLIERTFQREGSPYLACNDRNTFFTSEKTKIYHAWLCQNVCGALTFSLTTFYSIWHQAV